MKKRLGTGITLFVALIFVLINLPASPAWAGTGDVVINETNFPDATFREYVKTFDTDNDGSLSQKELDAVTDIDVRDKSIADLKGVEHFTKLESLYCSKNQLIALDVSQNKVLELLWCGDNKLTSLDVTKNLALTDFYCDNNQLIALDVSNNTALKALGCYNNQVTALDVSKNTGLMSLGCSNNQLKSLDVSKNTALKSLSCNENRLPALDVSHNTALEWLWCSSNQLTALDVTNNPELKWLSCDKNKLASLGVTNNTALEWLECNENKLTALDVSHNTALKNLNCSKNQLSALDVTNNTALELLYCAENQLTELDVSNNPKLKGITCEKNQLSALDVSKNTALELLLCNNNQLTRLDVSQNKDLIALSCHENQLTSLDVSQNKALVAFSCGTNQLTSLDLTENTSIDSFDGENQAYDISVDKNTLKFDLSSLPGNFNPKKASGWAGGTVSDNNTLTLDVSKPDKVTYSYDAGKGNKLSVTLNVTYGEVVSVTFDKNGGSGTMDAVTKKQGDSYKLPACKFTAPEGKEFKAWEVDGAEKAVGDSITVNADTTVKAIWKDKTVTPVEKVTITFDKNGGTGTMPSVTKNKGETYKLPICAFTAPDGKEFKGWEVDGTEKAVGDSITVNADTTVKAIWKKAGQPSKPHGGGVSSSTGTVTEPKEPEKPDEEKPAIDGSSAAYLAGYPDGSIRPDGVITRAESAKIIALLKEMDVSNTEKPAFGDLASGWYNPYINAVVRAGLMKGYLDGTFKPDAPITRAEFAQMIMPLDKENSAAAPFADVKGHWAEKAINQAYGNGRIKGYPDGTFRPDGQITRAEAVTICNNLFNRKVDGEGLKTTLKNPGKIKTFTDLDKSHWAYYEILEAANAHDYQIRHKGQMVENWIEVK